MLLPIQFELFANTIEDVSRLQFHTLFDSFRGMSKSLTREAISMNMTYPFVTSPGFEVFGQQARQASGVEIIGFVPFVEASELQAWNTYSMQHQNWIADSQLLTTQMEETDVTYPHVDLPPIVYDLTISPETGEMGMTPSQGEGPFLPLWQISPPPVSPFLLKVNTPSVPMNPNPQVAIEKTQGKETRRSSLRLFRLVSLLVNRVLSNPTDTILATATPEMTGFAESLLSTELHKHLHEEYPLSGNQFQPHASIGVPVFDGFDKATRKHVGNILGLFTMETFLINLLPEGVRGVFVVVENTCDQIFTFRLDGNRVSRVVLGSNHSSLKRATSFV